MKEEAREVMGRAASFYQIYPIRNVNQRGRRQVVSDEQGSESCGGR